MMKVCRILAATDFSPTANAAVKRASRLAHSLGADLHVLHVAERQLLELIERVMPGHTDRAVATARERLAETTEVLARHYAIRTAAHVSAGVAHVAIADTAAALGADLLVLGAHGVRPYRDLLLGSTTSRVLRLSTAPMLVVRNTGVEDYKDVLVAVDLQPSGAAGPTLELARALAPGARLEVFHAVPMPTEARATGATEEALGALRNREVAAARAALEALVASAAGVEAAQPVVAVGPPAGELLRRASRLRHGLVVIGRRGESTREATLLGGVARHVVEDAPCDVLVAS